MSSTRYDVSCPKCGAYPYESCRTLTTKRVTDTHRDRIEAQHTANQRPLAKVIPLQRRRA